ncbi:unknown [Clostridium sp. CAG:269]|jgi:hypothetical protein|nr:hypothetical protein [Clostridia bacterium]CDE54965.1 unknown [Clostridium sp. CAG:269]DAL24398.1 MAG TPA_asm: Protein of unknown function (DUF722) [Caudoviricetes sp.]
MRLENQEYRQAVNCLKRYNYNCIKIMSIREDIMSISGLNMDGMPKPKYSKSDMVLNSVIQLQEDEELKRAVKEVKAVQMALQLVDEDCKNIFEKIYIQSKSKWELINNGMSERTYFRKKTELITQVNKELKKLA